MDSRQTKKPPKASEDQEVQIKRLDLVRLSANPANPRRHTPAQIRALAKSIRDFGFITPIVIDGERNILAGHARYEASKLLGLTQVPTISVEHLSDTQTRAFMLADNQLAGRSTWDDVKLATHLKELSVLELDFDIEALGFELPEIDLRIQSLDAPDANDKADKFEPASGPAVSMVGDLWELDSHRLYCGNSVEDDPYAALFTDAKAAAVFIDPPFNLKVDGHVRGNGSITHREFAMASGEMTVAEFTDFLTNSLRLACGRTTGSAVIYICIDWRHMREMLAAGEATQCNLLNLCVWVKTNGGMGSFYRSRHELVFVYRNGKQSHQNNVQLGRFGRNRTNVWNYPGASGFAREGPNNLLDVHPTVKPIALVADAILDSTNRHDIVLDSFLGSGTTLIAAERTARRCYGIEIDPLYVDTTIERWQRMTGREARHFRGETFAALKRKRRAEP
jgi:DNA modification methylase